MFGNVIKPTEVHQKPHPDAIMKRLSADDTMPYPSNARARDNAEDVKDARARGYSVVVPVVCTADGSIRHVSIEPQVGGVGALNQVLRAQRLSHTGDVVPVKLLASEWGRLSAAERAKFLNPPPLTPVRVEPTAIPADRSQQQQARGR